MAHAPFEINESIPGDSALVAIHPAQARRLRSALLREHGGEGRHMFPNLTTTERDNITDWEKSSVIFNTTVEQFQVQIGDPPAFVWWDVRDYIPECAIEEDILLWNNTTGEWECSQELVNLRNQVNAIETCDHCLPDPATGNEGDCLRIVSGVPAWTACPGGGGGGAGEWTLADTWNLGSPPFETTGLTADEILLVGYGLEYGNSSPFAINITFDNGVNWRGLYALAPSSLNTQTQVFGLIRPAKLTGVAKIIIGGDTFSNTAVIRSSKPQPGGVDNDGEDAINGLRLWSGTTLTDGAVKIFTR